MTRLSWIFLLQSMLVVNASNVAVVGAQPVSGPRARTADTQVERQIQDEYGLSAIDALRLHHTCLCRKPAIPLAPQSDNC